MHPKFWPECCIRRDHLDNLGIDVRTILKKWGARVWNGFVQLETKYIGRLL
jgi:hypothetical protein